MEAMKNQFTELHSSHDNQLNAIEHMEQTNKQKLMEWENERNKLVCCYCNVVYGIFDGGGFGKFFFNRQTKINTNTTFKRAMWKNLW